MLAWIGNRPAAPSGIALSARTSSATTSASPLTTSAAAATTDAACTFARGAVSAGEEMAWVLIVSAPLLVQEGYILGIRFDVSAPILAEGVSQEQEKTITISWGVFPGDGATGASGRSSRLPATQEHLPKRLGTCPLVPGNRSPLECAQVVRQHIMQELPA